MHQSIVIVTYLISHTCMKLNFHPYFTIFTFASISTKKAQKNQHSQSQNEIKKKP